MSLRIGDRIKERRLKMDYTQDEVATKLGLNRVSYSLYESNRNMPPSDKLSALVDILNTNADYLLLKTDDPSPLPRQLYIDNSGQHLLMTAEETSQYYTEEAVNNKVRDLMKHIDEIDDNDKLDQFEKREFKNVLYETIELIKNEKKSVPLVGTICAGDGLLASENIEDHVIYPIINANRRPDFALRVKGNSMIESGIEDGDIVYLKQAPWADYNGQIVAAIINGDEGTLKRMKWTEGSPMVQLIPENGDFKTIEALPNEVYVCGVYMGHFKPERNI